MSDSTSTLKPKKGFLSLLKGKISRSRRQSSASSQASLQLDHPPPSTHVGTDEASDSTSVVSVGTSQVDRPVANDKVTSSPRPSGDNPRISVIVSPPDTTNGISEPTSSNEEPAAQTNLSEQGIPETAIQEVDPERERENALWAELQTSLQMLKDGPNIPPGIVSSIEVLLSCLDELKAMGRNQDEYQDLAKETTILSESLRNRENGLSSIPASNALSSVIMSIEHEVRAVKANLDRSGSGATEQAKTYQGEIVRYYRRIIALFRQLQVNANKSTRSISDNLANTRLERLDSVRQAVYDSNLSTQPSRRSCTPGTRASVFSELDEWLNGPVSPSVFWVDGTLGTGKTTIAYTFCERLNERKLLAASFFCVRDSEDCDDINRIVPTIAYQLAHYSIPFRSALYDALGHDPEAGSRVIDKQFEQLILEPIKQVKETLPDRLVVVIDALDECSNQNGVELLLDLIFGSTPDLPLKFLITSRPETEIHTKMTLHSKSRGAVHLNDIEKSLVQRDLKLYLAKELEFMSPGEADINQLVERAGLSFTYAANLLKYAHSDRGVADPHERLRSLINMSREEQHALIDPPYMKVVKKALEDEDLEDEEIEDIRVVLNTVLLAQEPISIETIGMLAGIGNLRRLETALHPLRPALHHSEKTGLVSALDSAFPEIMFSEERSGTYFCDVGKHSGLLARGCFLRMKEQLRFNICNLETSCIPDERLENIQSRIKDAIPPALSYACRFWAIHLGAATGIGDMLPMLSEFLSYRFLFWVEALNLRRELNVGVAGLLKAKERLEGASSPPEIITLVNDAYCFMRDFAACEAKRSTPHIYISSLQLCQRSSMVYRIYSVHIKNWLKPLENGTAYQGGQISAHQSWKVGSGTLSVAYSRDGTRIAVGCEDKTVSIYNAHDGSRVAGPLKGHTDWVRCVAFSPDGAYILSASSDGTIRQWDVSNGKLVDTSFEGHTHPVKSIAFSPDGRRVASGSWDNTVRIWGASDGSLIIGPLEEHKWGVNCVVFSPNNDNLLASGGNDHIIRLWDLSNDLPGSTELAGHTNGVTSIAFTPDGSRLVSGSIDCTIRIWSTGGGLEHTFLQGCTHPIYSVAMSPDGLCVASGSADSTIQVWDIESGKLVAGPFLGHSSGVRTIAFSPNGTQLLSGSHDDSVRAWDLRPEPKLPAPNPAFQNRMLNGVSSGRVSNRPGARVTQEPDYHTGQIRTFHQEKHVCLAFHDHTPIPVASSAWLLDGSYLAFLELPNDDGSEPADAVPASESAHGRKKQPDKDGWLRNEKSELLAWVPPTSGSCALSPHSDNNSKLLSLLLRDERFIGNRWPGRSKSMA